MYLCTALKNKILFYGKAQFGYSIFSVCDQLKWLSKPFHYKKVLLITLHLVMLQTRNLLLYFALQGEVLYDPILLPTEVFRPPQSKVENLKDVNFLGQKKVISTLSVRQKPAGQVRSLSLTVTST